MKISPGCWLCSALIVAGLLLPGMAAAREPGSMPEYLSLAPGGQPPDNWSGSPAVSANGERIAFVSLASNLVAGDTNDLADVFVLDRKNGEIGRVSMRSDGEQGNGWSYQPVVSADGRIVAFTSLSSNLNGESGGGMPLSHRQANVFVHDVGSGKTELVSAAASRQPNGWSDWPSLSADGRLVAFMSLADNLVRIPEFKDNNGAADVFVHDRQSGKTEWISIAADGKPGNGWSFHPAISANGRYVAFLTYATNLTGVPNTTVASEQTRLVVYDRLAGQLMEVIARDGEKDLNLGQSAPGISADGQWLLFAASQEGQGTRPVALYLFNRFNSELIEVTDSRVEQFGRIGYALSADYRWVVFSKSQPSGTVELMVYDRFSGKSEKLQDQGQGSGLGLLSQVSPAVSSNGKWVVFVGQPALMKAGVIQPDREEVFALERSNVGGDTGLVAGWVSDGLGHPLPGINLVDNYGHKVKTAADGSFLLVIPMGKSRGYSIILKPQTQGVQYSPEEAKVFVQPGSLDGVQIVFTAFPQKILSEAQKSIGMPYGQERGCDSPFRGCGGPYHGFYRGDCADLVLDAYRDGVEYSIQLALERDFWNQPSHYYRWRNARNTQDMWRFFAYHDLILSPSEPFQEGDIVFFDWEDDGIIDHVSLISEVTIKGQPRKMIDASGVIEDNPSGLAAELEWKPYHDQHVYGHTRWLGWQERNTPDPFAEKSWLNVAVDSQDVNLRLLNASGEPISTAGLVNDSSRWTDIDIGTTASLSLPDGFSEWIWVEVTADQPTSYQLGIQLIQNREIRFSTSQEKRSEKGQVDLIPIEITSNGAHVAASLPGSTP